MKRLIIFTIFIAAFGLMDQVYAQKFKNPVIAWGVSAGGVHGSNFGNDRWGMQYRGFLQVELIAPSLVGQFGLGYAALWAPGIYSAETGIADVRLHFSPFYIENLNPYVYGGVAASKSLNVNGSDYLPMVLMGIGIQTNLARGTVLDLTGGLNLSLSDDLDGRTRTQASLNAFTNERQDGFYGFTVGVAFAL